MSSVDDKYRASCARYKGVSAPGSQDIDNNRVNTSRLSMSYVSDSLVVLHTTVAKCVADQSTQSGCSMRTPLTCILEDLPSDFAIPSRVPLYVVP
jgi:hypothetical protein